jgi:hypothetical protein
MKKTISNAERVLKHVLVVNHGTIWTLQPRTRAAKRWLKENVEAPPWSWLGPRLCVDHSLAGNLVRGIAREVAGVEL